MILASDVLLSVSISDLVMPGNTEMAGGPIRLLLSLGLLLGVLFVVDMAVPGGTLGKTPLLVAFGAYITIPFYLNRR